MQIMSQVNFTTVVLTKCDRCCSRNNFKLHGDLMLSVVVVIIFVVCCFSELLYPEGSISPTSGIAADILCRGRDYLVSDINAPLRLLPPNTELLLHGL